MNAYGASIDALSDRRIAWRSAAWRRLRTRMPIKCASVIGGTALFFWAYFAVMRAPLAAPTLVPVTRWDYLIPISEAALLWYASLWAYIPVAPALARDRRELNAYWLGAVGMSLIGLLTFWWFPTAVPDLPIDWHRYPRLAFLKTADVSGNALPSMHVAFAVYTVGVIALQLRQIAAPAWLHAISVGWALAIVWSTMATRQHLVVDVAGGALLGGLAVALTRREGRIGLRRLASGRRRRRPAPVDSG